MQLKKQRCNFCAKKSRNEKKEFDGPSRPVKGAIFLSSPLSLAVIFRESAGLAWSRLQSLFFSVCSTANQSAKPALRKLPSIVWKVLIVRLRLRRRHQRAYHPA